MKKTTLFMGIILLFFLSLYPLFGILLEKHIQTLLAELFSAEYIQYQIEPSQKGFFSSNTTLELKAAEEFQWEIDRGLDFLGIYPYPVSAAISLRQEHGPFPFGDGLDGISIRPVAGRVSVQFDREKNQGAVIEKLLRLGIKPQLTATIYLDRSGSLKGKLPAHRLANTTENTSFSFLCSWTDCLFSVDYDAKLDDIALHGENESFQLNILNDLTLQTSGLKMESNLQQLLHHPKFHLQGRSDSLTFGFGGVKEQATIIGTSFSAEGAVAKHHSSGKIRLSMQQVKWEAFSLSDCLVSAKISGIPLGKLLKDTIALGQPQMDMFAPEEILQSFDQPLRQIIRPGVRMTIDAFHFDIAGESFANHISGKTDIKVVKPLPEKLIPDISLLQCMDADGEFSLPQESVKSMIRQVIEESALSKLGNMGSMIAGNNAISKFVSARMAALEQKGILVKDGKNYRLHITWKGGKLWVNGKQFSMKLLLPSLL